MFFIVDQTETFTSWLAALRDLRAQAVIAERLARLARGTFGDAKSVGDGVSELRVHHGPGYRAYYVRRGERLVILLCGGDKGSQPRDIVRAKALAREV